MKQFILQRAVILIPFLFLVSVMSFVIIQLPPGDYVDSYIRNLQLQGGTVNEAQKADLEAQYGLDKPMYIQYLKWMGMVLQGNFGMALAWTASMGAATLFYRYVESPAASVRINATLAWPVRRLFKLG